MAFPSNFQWLIRPPAGQSAGHVIGVSSKSHNPFGQQTPQSARQLSQVSVPLQSPSPQNGGGGGHSPQSASQVTQVSPKSQKVFGQHGPQSSEQLLQFSPSAISQVRFGQVEMQAPPAIAVASQVPIISIILSVLSMQ